MGFKRTCLVIAVETKSPVHLPLNSMERPKKKKKKFHKPTANAKIDYG